ncbi:MerR family transcriptional regulator [Mesobacterium sp. TK19101]|uniref:MerR family transcriptional regulator n=1 Tax=Mesobacterium hydrothermale TaxID=3111907 RepID=A0ABU6HN78_9RHOB|nr:MerR family transcriptional regulator [Mesobacterium sp. TK19101]MEC3863394.1 MerR family transcriptional regulator [Mesobacterium sp. TK19101]
MTNYTVSEVAKMAGISVRTLHHYHEISLLRPAYVGENSYRYYGREELLRLQQILVHRELGIPLGEIGAILDVPGFDRLTALKSQRERIAQEVARSAEMLRTIDRTIAELEGDRAMKDAELYSGIVDPKKQAEYEAWLEKKYGPEIGKHIETSRRKMENLSPAERDAMMSELKDIEQQFAKALRDGVPPEAQSLDPLIERHRAWVASSWGRDCPPTAYSGLADNYEHPDFVARYEAIEEGFSRYLCAAMRSWAKRQS